VQIENLVSECGRRFQQDGHQASIPAFVIEPGEMLNGGSSTLTGKLQQSILVDALAEIGWQLDCPGRKLGGTRFRSLAARAGGVLVGRKMGQTLGMRTSRVAGIAAGAAFLLLGSYLILGRLE
jgi:hypothetical protein